MSRLSPHCRRHLIVVTSLSDEGQCAFRCQDLLDECIGDLVLVQTHPPEKCVRFDCQESGAHSFGRLAAIDRALYQPWREAANPATNQRATGLAPWQWVCESGAPPLS